MKLKFKVAVMTAADPRDFSGGKSQTPSFHRRWFSQTVTCLEIYKLSPVDFLSGGKCNHRDQERNCLQLRELRRAAQIKLQSHRYICCDGITLFSGIQYSSPGFSYFG